jgi:hypothetical protein
MQRFLLQDKIARFAKLLKREPDPRARVRLRQVLHEAKRELARAEADHFGVQAGFIPLGQAPHGVPQTPAIQGRFRNAFEDGDGLQLLIDPRPGLRIIDANQAYRDATLTGTEIFGQGMFDVFPDNPGDPAADGVSNLFTSLRNATLLGAPQVMNIQRYDVRNAAGVFVERYWRPVNTPIFGPDERLSFILHHVENVTEEVQAARATGRAQAIGDV